MTHFRNIVQSCLHFPQQMDSRHSSIMLAWKFQPAVMGGKRGKCPAFRVKACGGLTNASIPNDDPND